MYIELIQLVTNTALWVLIWIVQLVIYPGFLRYSESDIKHWHGQYTTRVSYIIAPLMLGQLVAYGYAVYLNSWTAILCLALIFVNWGVTFFIAVPLHNKIDTEPETIVIRERLVRVNWIRTVAWTLVFIISLIEYGK